MLRYLLPLAGSVLAGMMLVKDWNAHKTTWRRAAIMILIVFTGIGSAVNSHQESKRAETRTIIDRDTITAMDKRIAALQTAADTANANQAANTKIFAIRFESLSVGLGKLQSEVKAERLKEEVKNLQGALKQTQAALVQPKAKLTMSFQSPQKTGEAVRIVTLPLQEDGSLHIEMFMANISEADALDGDIVLRICESCRFLQEPAGFMKISGGLANERSQRFDRILRNTVIPKVEVDIFPPIGVDQIGIQLTYRCRTCILPGRFDNSGSLVIKR